MTMTVKFFKGLCLLTICAGVTGCSSDSGPELGFVTGVVTLDGKPLPDANVAFQPEDGAPSYGTTDAQGRYELVYTPKKKGAVVGKHTVRISTYQVLTEENGGKREIPEKAPPEFNTETKLFRDVKPGEQTFDFPIP